ncbi:hypothetical protein ACVWXQ_009336 [Bradyrhizobium sp. S3.14.4]
MNRISDALAGQLPLEIEAAHAREPDVQHDAGRFVGHDAAKQLGR